VSLSKGGATRHLRHGPLAIALPSPLMRPVAVVAKMRGGTTARIRSHIQPLNRLRSSFRAALVSPLSASMLVKTVTRFKNQDFGVATGSGILKSL